MLLRTVVVTLMSGGLCVAGEMLKFEKIRIGDVIYEAASVCDVNKDGQPDIVSGEYWFEGPSFKKAHKICTIKREEDYYDDFADIPMDVNGDGYPDIITGGWWGERMLWRENPQGRDVEWKTHEIDKCGNVETARVWDVDGDGQLEVVPNAGGRIAFYKLVLDASGKGTGKFTKHVVKEGGCGHGFGFGDINGDGRGDFVVPDAWIEAPKDRLKEQWIWHPEFKLGGASDPIIVYDVNGDGLADLIVGEAHAYGLYWMEQKKEGEKRTWIRHDIDPHRSQYHELVLFDIDKCGKPELITGKRFRAHQWNDPGSKDPLGIYYFKIDGGKFTRYTIDYGPYEKAKGAGIYLWIEDVDGNGWADIVAPGKEGLCLFKNMGPTGAK